MFKIRKKYSQNEDGNVAMMFAASILMLATGVGVAIDYSNMTRLQTSLQGQVDAAVLAAALADVSEVKGNKKDNYGLSKKDERKSKEKEIREAAALGVIQANGYDLENGAKPILDMTDETVMLSAETTYKPFFGKLIGKEKMTISAVSESGLGGLEGVEIVLVLDNTDSMRVNGKMDALKTGATNLVDAIEESDSGSKIGVVPFSRYVRVSTNLSSESWFQMPIEFDTPRTIQQATHTGGTCVPVTRTRTIDGVEETYETRSCEGRTTTYEDVDKVLESRWDGCVGLRAAPYNEEDGSYMFRIPGLLNFEPAESSDVSWDHWNECPEEILAMTDDYAEVKSTLSNLHPVDLTYLPSGLSWGERVLSPGAPYDNQNEDELRQIMVLMTDGHNTVDTDEDPGLGQFGEQPYLSEVSDQNAGSPAADAATLRLCNSVKASGVEIYTIAFQVTNTSTQSLLSSCASDPSKALIAGDNAALIETFETISNTIKSEVRLMR